MASGLVCRANRPNTWLHRPSLRREVFPCQLGAVHTWQEESIQWVAPENASTDSVGACRASYEAPLRTPLGYPARRPRLPRKGGHPSAG
jgi:hypothetical protein